MMNRLIRRIWLPGIFLACLMSGSAVEASPVTTAEGNITFFGAGWVVASVRVNLDVAFSNPEGCSSTDGYVVDPADSGANLFATSLLTAHAARRKVSLVIDGCWNGRPRIIGVNVAP